MADESGGFARRLIDVVKSHVPLVDGRRLTTETWLRWFRDFRRDVQGAVDDTTLSPDQSITGRIEALEEEVKSLRLREQAREIEAALTSPEVAPRLEAVSPADFSPIAVERAPEQIVSVSDVEEIRQRVSALEGIAGGVAQACGVADAIETIREQAIADTLSVAPVVETGQLFKSRQLVQLIDPSQMYLPVTQPAAGPNIYETVANGSAWRCFEFAPGTLAADNDNVEFIVTPPLGWDTKPVQARAIWSHSATVTNFLVAWRFQAGQYIDSSAGNAALSAENANVVQDQGGTTDSVYISVGTNVTPVNVTTTDTGFNWSPLLWRVGRRNNSEGAVGLGVNARLLGVVLIWGIKPQTQI